MASAVGVVTQCSWVYSVCTGVGHITKVFLLLICLMLIWLLGHQPKNFEGYGWFFIPDNCIQGGAVVGLQLPVCETLFL